MSSEPVEVPDAQKQTFDAWLAVNGPTEGNVSYRDHEWALTVLRNLCGAAWRAGGAELEAQLIAMTEDRDLWQDAHDDDCPNKAMLETTEAQLRQERETTKDLAQRLGSCSEQLQALEMQTGRIEEYAAAVAIAKENKQLRKDVESWKHNCWENHPGLKRLDELQAQLLQEREARPRMKTVHRIELSPAGHEMHVTDEIPCADSEWDALQAQLRQEREAHAATIRQLMYSIDHRLNERLVDMKPEWDDSITGFNEAWDIVRKVFAEVHK